jgi:hypothetical protein
VGHGRVTLAHVLTAGQREQDRITNRTWRRPGGLARPAGLSIRKLTPDDVARLSDAKRAILPAPSGKPSAHVVSSD